MYSYDDLNMATLLKEHYLKSFPSKLELLSAAIRENDFESIQRLGHQLRGSGSSYGFPEITAIGSEIEAAGELKQSYQLNILLGSLESTIKRIADGFQASEQV